MDARAGAICKCEYVGQMDCICTQSDYDYDMNTSAVKLQVRMERGLKEQAEEVFAEMGLDTTTAVRIFFTKVAKTRSIPFRLQAEPEFTREEESRILEAWAESKDRANLSGPFDSTQELFRHLDQEVEKQKKTKVRASKKK
jgi:DNA-damage-inducible protein J